MTAMLSGTSGHELGKSHGRTVEPSAERPAARRIMRREIQRLAVTLGGVLVVGAMLGAHVVHQDGGRVRILPGWPGIQYVVYAVWMVPLIELGMLAAGQFYYRRRFRVAAAGTFRGMIIQVTTTGREQDRVNEIIEQLRGYQLSMPYEVWVVTEPAQSDRYPAADVVLTVPASFVVRSAGKARALEYSRRARMAYGLDRDDIKILFNDDDVALTREYIETAFVADYDICEGITSPRTEYAVRPFGHFLASHADDLRTHACLVYCSVFQGVFSRPLHVHGEGLMVTGYAESIVTWDWPIFASEDLVFGQKAARSGLTWGWFHEYAELTSPWTLRDFITQRRRWLWGDIHGIRHRDALPLPAAAAVAAKYLISLITIVYSMAGLLMRLTGQLPRSPLAFTMAKLAVVTWLAVVFACGWIGASSTVSGRSDDSRMISGVLAVLMLPVSAVMTIAGIMLSLAEGSPNTFQVIRKTKGGHR
jgi:hypothetical protein